MNEVLYEKKSHIVYITMNRPEKLNAINGELNNALNSAVDRYSADNEAWCAIVTGAGRAFSTGADLAWVLKLTLEEENGLQKMIDAGFLHQPFRDCPKPIIAAVNGYCLASAFTIAVMCCDFRIASERAVFGLPDVKWGRSAPYHFPAWLYMTLGDAAYLAFTGKEINAEEALRMRLVTEVVPHDKLMDRTTEIAELICENGPLGIRYTKIYTQTVLGILGADWGDKLAALLSRQTAYSEDLKEGLNAFLEKRKPQWKNK